MGHATQPSEEYPVEEVPGTGTTNPRGWARPGRAAVALGAVATVAGLAALAGYARVADAPSAATPAIVTVASAQAVVAEIVRSAPEPTLFDSADAPPALRIMTFSACFEASACEEQSVAATTATLSPEAQALWQGAPLEADETGGEEGALAQSKSPAVESPPVDSPPVDSLVAEAPAPSAETLAANSAPILRTVPLPVRRPMEFRQDFRQALAREMARRDARPVAAPMQAAAMPATPADNRSAFEKLFGVQQQPASPAMAYAALETQPAAIAPTPARRALVPAPAPVPLAVAPPPAPMPVPRAGGGTAVYDISAKTVTLPSGERLEAHSGLGDAIDDPRRVHERMKGSTPPGTYDLTWRETSFHGVQALRMTPVGGSAAIHGRNGILAHHNLRGPSGESNGCVSFRNYERFRQAYARGEVSRLVVVSGNGSNGVSNFVSRLFGGS